MQMNLRNIFLSEKGNLQMIFTLCNLQSTDAIKLHNVQCREVYMCVFMYIK
jgi:hypothetical protein